jgi:hypothetical protein
MQSQLGSMPQKGPGQIHHVHEGPMVSLAQTPERELETEKAYSHAAVQASQRRICVVLGLA